MSVVEVSRGCVEFEGEHVLEDVDLRIEAGEFVALLGPNGSGKTTLVRAILGLQPLDHGKVTLFGVPLAKFRDWRRIALVPQRLPNATSVPVSVWEAALSAHIRPQVRWRPFPREARAAVKAALQDVGLWERRRDRADTLSGGQQRRVLIARALSMKPDLLVLDEPTAGLDERNLAVLMRVLTDLRSRGTTVIVVTHDLAELGDLVTRAIVLRHGDRDSVRYDGPPPVPDDLADAVHHHDQAPGPQVPPVIELEA